MNNYPFIPEKLKVLTSKEHLKAYIHPTRMSLLQMLGKEQRSISSIARELGVHPATITHHFKLLEKLGLILLVEKRDTGKNLEKYYRAVAYSFVVESGEMGPVDKKALALSILRNDLSAAIATVGEKGEHDSTALLATVKISPDQVSAFAERLEALVNDFKAYGSTEGRAYTINLSLYPNVTDNLTTLPHTQIRL